MIGLTDELDKLETSDRRAEASRANSYGLLVAATYMTRSLTDGDA